MMINELTPYIMLYGIISISAVLLVFPMWAYLKIESLHRSMHLLREDMEMQELELKQLRDKVIVPPIPTEGPDDW